MNSGEILLVSVKDGPWSALVSWRRRGFSRASPAERGWWKVSGPRGAPRRGVAGSEVVGRESASGRRVPKGGARSPRGGARGLYPPSSFALSLSVLVLLPFNVYSTLTSIDCGSVN